MEGESRVILFLFLFYYLFVTCSNRILGSTHCTICRSQRTPVPDYSDEQGKSQRPVRFPETSALSLPVLHEAPGAVHKGPHPT